MGVGHLDIGENKGGAQIFGANPAIQQYGQILATRQAKQAADNKLLGDELAKDYDPSGLRNDADKSAYIKKYNDIKQSAIDIENEKDPTKKAIGLSQVRQQLTNLGAWAGGSKKQGVLERQIAMQALTNPHLLTDNSATRLKSQMQKVYDDDSVIRDPTGFERGVDPAKIDAEYAKHKEFIQKGSPVTFDNGTLSPKQDLLGKQTATLTQRRVVPFQDALEHTLNYATSDMDYQKYLNDKYPQIATDNPKATLALRVKQDMQDRGDGNGFIETKSKDIEGYKPAAPKEPSWLEQYWLKHAGVPYNPNPPGQALANQPSPSQILGLAMKDGTPGSGEKFLSLVPKQYGDNKKPAIDIDPKTGEQVFQFDAHIDPIAVEFNKSQKAKWAKENPGEPFDPTDKDYKLKQEVIKPAKLGKDAYRLNPASPTYLADFAQMAKEQNVNLSQLDKIESIKGGHGQIPQAQIKATPKQPKVATVSSDEDYKSLPKGAQYMAPDGKIYIKK